MVFGDLTNAEMAVSFILSMPEKERQHLKKELKYAVLLDTTSWLGENYKFGCLKCASFLNRTKVT